MTFQTALGKLATLTVTGIANHYSMADVPDSLHRAQLPALLVMPLDTQDDSLSQESGRAFDGIAFSDGTKTVQYATTHLLIVAPLKKGKGLRNHLVDVVTLIDNYVSAFSEDVTLDGTLEHPATIRIEPGIFKIADTQYIGCAFRHRWTITV